jgi:hypothetical protein
MSQCRNCGAYLTETYCPRCGQKDVDLERPITQLIGDVFKETFDLDGRAARTIRALLTRPGLLTREFLAGHRRRYTPPVRLYLIVSVAFFLITTWVVSQGMLLEEGQDLAVDAPDQARFAGEELPRLMFLLLPAFALLLKLAFWRRLYFDHLIFALHFHTAAYITLALILPMEDATVQYWPAIVAQFALLFYLLAYLVIALRRVYDCGWAGAMTRSAGILLGYLVMVSMVIETASSFLNIGD